MALSFLLIIQANRQSFFHYKDSLNYFSIDIPIGWKYEVTKEQTGVLLLAYRTPSFKSDNSRHSVNINIINTPTKNLDKLFADFIKYLLNTQNYKLIATGDTTVNGTKFKWPIETYNFADIQMHEYALVTVRDGKTYILTMVSFSGTFDTVKPLFDKIASSFIFLN